LSHTTDDLGGRVALGKWDADNPPTAGLNDVQRSPHYPGGVALRFARIKGYRHDKRAEDADTIESVLRLAPS